MKTNQQIWEKLEQKIEFYRRDAQPHSAAVYVALMELKDLMEFAHGPFKERDRTPGVV
jgi:hypothetical protein